MLDHIKFTKFKFILEAVDNIRLPEYKGAALRGGFGYTFRKTVCAQSLNKDCNNCMLKEQCVYSYIFETPPPQDTEKLRLYKTVPHPFVLEPPQDSRRLIKKGEMFAFNIALIGKAVDYLPYIVFTFIKLGATGIGAAAVTHNNNGKRPPRGKYILKDAQCIDLEGKTNSIFNYEQQTIDNNYPILEAANLNHIDDNDVNAKEITLNFITPCRIKFDGKIGGTMAFHILIRNLLRRVSSISYFHCNKELECNFNAIIDKAKDITIKKADLKWQDWERYSTRQKQKMSLGGLIGNITFQGDLKPFLQLLRLGEYLHVGKGTSFGLGRYVIL